MTEKKRPLFILICEITALVFVFLSVSICGSSAYAKDLFRKIDYPRSYVEYVRKYSFKYGTDENLMFAIIKAGSDFNPDAESESGAVGLMQITPARYESDIKQALSLDTDTYTALRSPDINIQCGTYYFSHCIKSFKTTVKAVAAYIGGEDTVLKWSENPELLSPDGDLDPEKIPHEATKKSVLKVLRICGYYEQIYGGKKTYSEVFIERGKALEYAKKYGAQFRVDYNLIMAVIETESSFRCYEVSSSGAIGLMQIKADTYKGDIAANLGFLEEADELFNAEFNILSGTYYLHWLDERVDGIISVAAAYHGGIGNVRSWLSDEELAENGRLIAEKIPDAATKRYVEKIRAFYEKSVSLDGADANNKFDW